MVDKSVPAIAAMMIKYDVDTYPRYPMPEGFSVIGYRPGLEKDWAEIGCQQHGMESMEKAEAAFRSEFLSRPQWVKDRCLFVMDEKKNRVAALISLWLGKLSETEPLHARIHWVATREEYQGMGLMKSVFSFVMDLYHSLGDRGYIYLTTQTGSYVAINIYKKFGFVPYLGELHPADTFDLAAHCRAWEIIDGKIAEYKARR